MFRKAWVRVAAVAAAAVVSIAVAVIAVRGPIRQQIVTQTAKRSFGQLKLNLLIPVSYTHLDVYKRQSYYCTLCIVPYVRGRFDHRPPKAILDETRERIAQGAREIVLVGQTVNAWNDPASGEDFGDLCRSIAALPGLERLGFISPHPKDFTEKILDDLCSLEQLNPRIHLPLQSGSDALLRRMNRKYTLAQFDAIVQSIRRRLPDCAITTDLIVGFPGETASDFQATLDVYKRQVHIGLPC